MQDRTVAIIRGGGKQGAVVFETVKLSYCRIMIWDDGPSVHPLLVTFPRFSVEMVHNLDADEIHCFVAIGSGATRRKLVEAAKEALKGARLVFPSVIHSLAFISPSATINQGCYVGPFALVNTAATVGEFCLINSAAIVEHDCVVGDYVTLNPGSVLLGTVQVGANSTVNAKATVRENHSVGENTVIGMGATVVGSVESLENGFWGGVPARAVFPERDKK